VHQDFVSIPLEFVWLLHTWLQPENQSTLSDVFDCSVCVFLLRPNYYHCIERLFGLGRKRTCWRRSSSNNRSHFLRDWRLINQSFSKTGFTFHSSFSYFFLFFFSDFCCSKLILNCSEQTTKRNDSYLFSRFFLFWRFGIGLNKVWDHHNPFIRKHATQHNTIFIDESVPSVFFDFWISLGECPLWRQEEVQGAEWVQVSVFEMQQCQWYTHRLAEVCVPKRNTTQSILFETAINCS
jgi:hypothetical protein